MHPPDSSPPPAPSPTTTPARCDECEMNDNRAPCSWCDNAAKPAPPAPAPGETTCDLRRVITMQQTRALIRLADNEAEPGDVALVYAMARAISATQHACPDCGHQHWASGPCSDLACPCSGASSANELALAVDWAKRNPDGKCLLSSPVVLAIAAARASRPTEETDG